MSATKIRTINWANSNIIDWEITLNPLKYFIVHSPVRSDHKIQLAKELIESEDFRVLEVDYFLNELSLFPKDFFNSSSEYFRSID